MFAKTDICSPAAERCFPGYPATGLTTVCNDHSLKATSLLQRLLVYRKPVVFCGGVTCNSSVIRAIGMFDLTKRN